MLDESKDVGASNRRHLAALHCGATSGFEVWIFFANNYLHYIALKFSQLQQLIYFLCIILHSAYTWSRR